MIFLLFRAEIAEFSVKLCFFLQFKWFVLGVVVDPTTAGIGGSERALGYEAPWTDPEDDSEEN